MPSESGDAIKIGIIRGHGGEIQPLYQGDVERIAGQERVSLDILKHARKICRFNADQMNMRQQYQLPQGCIDRRPMGLNCPRLVSA